jgi:hypothetical protein
MKTPFSIGNKPSAPPTPCGPHFNAGHCRLYFSGNGETFSTLVNSNHLVIGSSDINPEVIRKEIDGLRRNKHFSHFTNSDGKKGARRGPCATGPPGYEWKSNMEILSNEAPNLHKFIKHVEEEYRKTGKVLTGFWWTYYRSETEKMEVIWVPLGTMKAHCDKFGKVITDRVILTVGCNTKGKQKRMSFEYSGVKNSKVWINIHHGMYVCLSEESSGSKLFRLFRKTYRVKHGVTDADGTYTFTMQFKKEE